MQLKEFTPPNLVKLARRLIRKTEKGYASYEEALSVCKNGYAEDGLASVVYEKTKIYREWLLKQQPFVSELSSLRTLIGLSLARRADELNVIDFGGACGAHYFISKMAFGEKIDLRWHVVETPQMVSKAIGLADGSLKFFDDLQEAKRGFERVDLVFSSGALQYVRQPYHLLERLVECGAENIFLTRVALSDLPKELIVVQTSRLSDNGPGPMPKGMRDAVVQYPATLARKDRFEEILSRQYSIDILFKEDEGVHRAGGQSIDTHGYFGSIKKDR